MPNSACVRASVLSARRQSLAPPASHRQPRTASLAPPTAPTQPRRQSRSSHLTPCTAHHLSRSRPISANSRPISANTEPQLAHAAFTTLALLRSLAPPPSSGHETSLCDGHHHGEVVRRGLHVVACARRRLGRRRRPTASLRCAQVGGTLVRTPFSSRPTRSYFLPFFVGDCTWRPLKTPTTIRCWAACGQAFVTPPVRVSPSGRARSCGSIHPGPSSRASRVPS